MTLRELTRLNDYSPEILDDKPRLFDMYNHARTVNETLPELKESLTDEEFLLGWAESMMGFDNLEEYFFNPLKNPNYIMRVYDRCKTPELKALWSAKYEKSLERTPSIEIREKQLRYLCESWITLAQVYPEVNLKMIPLQYKNIEQNYMPHQSWGDAHYSRIDSPYCEIIKTIEMNSDENFDIKSHDITFKTSVDHDLLCAIRDKNNFDRAGNLLPESPLGELRKKAYEIGDYGLMLFDEKLYTREKLREINMFTGINTLSAGLAEGIAFTQTGSLRINDFMHFPKTIPNQAGDIYCGIEVKRIFVNNPTHNPEIIFSMHKDTGLQDESPYCVLAITA